MDATNNTAAAANPFLLPLQAWTQMVSAMPGMGLWHKAMTDGVDRMRAMTEEFAKIENAGAEQLRAAMDENARLSREGFTYTRQLTAAMRAMALDATKRSVDALAPKAG